MQKLSFDEEPNPSQVLHSLAVYSKNRDSDKYMSGEIFDELHNNLREVLGVEDALYLPSGKMAQMIAMKLHTSQRRCSRIAVHPRSHMEEYEARAYSELWGLSAVQLGGYDRLPTAEDLDNIKEKLGAVVIELPMRKLGCLLPSWDQLCAISDTARERNIPLHLDGARLWESQPFYDRPYAEIVSIFDSVYVSFDKGLGCLAGGALVGTSKLVDEAKIWQRRAGGRSLRSFPTILSALQGLEERLPLMAEFHEKAKDLATVMGKFSGVSVAPRLPHANAFFVTFQGNRARAYRMRDRVASETGLRLFEELVDCVDQSMIRFEVTIRGAGLIVTDDNVIESFKRFLEYCSE